MTGLFRHWGFLTSINDLANFDQAIWGTINGEFLLNTDLFNMPISRLAIHFDPIQLVFVPFYLLYPSVAWLTAGQSFALAITAWPIFTLASRVLESEKLGLLWALIFLVNPFILNAGAWDFHPITLAVPFVAFGFVGLESKNFKFMLFSAFIILMCKEHLGIMITCFGILWWIKTRRWVPALILVLLGITHFYFVLKVIMPALSPTGAHLMMSDEMPQFDRYTWLGKSFGEMIENAVSSPITILKTALISMGGLSYLLILMLPFLFFPLLTLTYLLPGLADLAANILSEVSLPKSPIGYHSATLIPILTISAIYGLKKIMAWQKRYSLLSCTAFILFSSIIMGYLLAPLPLPKAINYWKPNSFVNLPDHRIKEIHRLIGKDTSVSIQANLGSHFSQRRDIYRFPNKIDKVDIIIFRFESPTMNINNLKQEKEAKRGFPLHMLDNHLQMDKKDYLTSVEKLLEDKNFGIVYWDNPWLVLKRGKKTKDLIADVLASLEELRKKWQQPSRNLPERDHE